MKPMEEGLFFGVSADEYHRDALHEQPSLSSSLAKLLITETPAHCRWHSRRLNPKWRDEPREIYDRGTIAHALILNSGDQDRVYKILAKDWRSRDARELRDAARADGKIPILESDYDELMEMRDASVAQLEKLEGENPFAIGHPEVVMRWKEDVQLEDTGEIVAVWCRARIDWWNPESENLYDLKTSASAMPPAQWARWTSWSSGAPYQSAFYRSGMRRLAQIGKLQTYDPDFVFCLLESSPPYCVSLVNFPPDVRQRFGERSADEKVTEALQLWAKCLRDNEWPGYPTGVVVAEGARPLVTRDPVAPQPEPQPIPRDDMRFHANSDDVARDLAHSINTDDDRDLSYAAGLGLGKK